MKQKVPFEKEIAFKTNIGEITSISLDHDLMFKEKDLISGNFYIDGSYKMLSTSTEEFNYNYKIPCEIAISDDYDTSNAFIDIDDFNYEIDKDYLKVNIVVAIDNLIKKEEEIEFLNPVKEEKIDPEEIKVPTIDERSSKISFLETQEKVKKQADDYLTYKVYMYKETDSIESVLEKYNTTIDELSDYNDLENLAPGVKLVIPTND